MRAAGQRVVVQPIEALAIDAERPVGSVRSVRDGAHPALVQPRAHGVARLVVHDADDVPSLVLGGHDLALRGADPERIDGDPLGCGLLGLLQALALEILAVAEEHHRLLVSRLGRKSLGRHVDGAPDVGSPAGDDRRVERVHVLEERVMVQRHGALHERVSGERDETYPVARKLVHEILDRELHPSEACRLHVVRVHALGRVDHEEQIDPLTLHRLPVHPLLRARQRAEAHGDGERRDPHAQPPAERRRERRVGGTKAGARKQRQRPGAEALGTSEEREQERDTDRSDEEPHGVCESHGHSPRGRKHHGTRRKRVADRPISPISAKRPGIANHEKRSVFSEKLLRVRVVFSSRSISAYTWRSESVSVAR